MGALPLVFRPELRDVAVLLAGQRREDDADGDETKIFGEGEETVVRLPRRPTTR